MCMCVIVCEKYFLQIYVLANIYTYFLNSDRNDFNEKNAYIQFAH